MARYLIKSYKKEKQSFLSEINSLDDIYGNAHNIYTVTLEKFILFGLFKIDVMKRISLPKGFSHKKELFKGREFNLTT